MEVGVGVGLGLVGRHAVDISLMSPNSKSWMVSNSTTKTWLVVLPLSVALRRRCRDVVAVSEMVAVSRCGAGVGDGGAPELEELGFVFGVGLRRAVKRRCHGRRGRGQQRGSQGRRGHGSGGDGDSFAAVRFDGAGVWRWGRSLVEIMLLISMPTWLSLMSLNSKSWTVSNSTAKTWLVVLPLSVALRRPRCWLGRAPGRDEEVEMTKVMRASTPTLSCRRMKKMWPASERRDHRRVEEEDEGGGVEESADELAVLTDRAWGDEMVALRALVGF